MKDYFMMSAEEAAEALGISSDSGLTEAQAEQNKEKYGPNAFSREKPVSTLQRIAESCKEPMIFLLFIAAAITLAVNIVKDISGGVPEYYECIGIFAAIFISIILSVVMEGKSAKAFEALSRMNDDIEVKVVRGGRVMMIPQQELTVGDVVFIATGDRIPADGRLLYGSAVQSDESSLTGESAHVDKDASAVFDNPKTPLAERTNMLYSGCFITGGSGAMAVTAVGDETEFGKIAAALRVAEKTSTPLQEKLAKLGKIVALIGAVCAAIVFIIQLVGYVSAGAASFDTVSEAFITSIVLIVAAVPEGLPTIVAVSLSINIIKMSRQNALVKKMIACETVGCINVICSDKTGTLTENRMTVTDIYRGGTMIKPSELDSESLFENFCLNGTADIAVADGVKTFLGNPTECALLYAAFEAGRDYKQMRGDFTVAHSFPFSSDLKYMTTVVKKDGGYTVYVKGSPEKILAMCKGEFSKEEEAISASQKQARRVIGFAHKDISGDIPDFEASRADFERDMVFDGFTAIMDPLRSDVYAAVSSCRSAGIDVKILTGDNITTASAIAGELGLIDDEHIAIEAREIDNMSDEELYSIVYKIRVIARSTPTVKMRIVKLLKADGNIVAVTGDGINDAPALKNADVGIAMGITGTDVSKEASDIVLLDDAFSTIVKAVKWGRGIYDNFKRFLQFQLTVNVSSVLVILISIIAGLPAPFTALELLWINIIMDGPPALTLGLEPVREDLMKRKPVPRGASLLSKDMTSRILACGLYITVICMLQYMTNFMGAAEGQMQTVMFTMFAIFQLMNALNCREMGNTSIFRHMGGNNMLLFAILGTLALQFVITQFGGMVFGTVPLDGTMWAKVIGMAASVIAVSEILRLIKFLMAKARQS